MYANPTNVQANAVIPLDSQISYVKTWLELCSLLGRDADRPKLEAILDSLESLKMVRADAEKWLVANGHKEIAGGAGVSDYDHDGEEEFDQCELDGNGRCQHVHPGMSHREYEREEELNEITRRATAQPQRGRAG